MYTWTFPAFPFSPATATVATERHNGTTQRQNGNGRTATEWWKPRITVRLNIICCIKLRPIAFSLQVNCTDLCKSESCLQHAVSIFCWSVWSERMPPGSAFSLIYSFMPQYPPVSISIIDCIVHTALSRQIRVGSDPVKSLVVTANINNADGLNLLGEYTCCSPAERSIRSDTGTDRRYTGHHLRSDTTSGTRIHWPVLQKYRNELWLSQSVNGGVGFRWLERARDGLIH